MAERGSTLIEALVATMILVSAGGALLNMITISAMTARTNALNAHAVALATQEREDLRSLVYSAMASRDPYPASAPDTFNGVAFAVHSDVLADQPAPNMKTLTVTVSWTFAGRPRSYALQSVYTNING